MGRLGKRLPKEISDPLVMSATDFEVSLNEIKLITENMCSPCGGSGRLPAMQLMAVIGGGSVRGPDTTTGCRFCNGTGRR